MLEEEELFFMVYQASPVLEVNMDCSRKCIIGFTYVWCKKNYKYNSNHINMLIQYKI